MSTICVNSESKGIRRIELIEMLTELARAAGETTELLEILLYL